MKIISRSITTALILCPLFFRCSKKDDAAPVLAPEGTLIATVNDKSFASETTVALMGPSTITIAGTDANGGVIVLRVNNTVAGGFDVKGTTADASPASVEFARAGHDTYVPNGYGANAKIGSVVVTEIDATAKTISGTFYSTVKRYYPTEEEVVISTGSFKKLPYTQVGATPANSFELNIDGLTLTEFTRLDATAGEGVFEVVAFNDTISFDLRMTLYLEQGTHPLGVQEEYSFGISRKDGLLYSTSGTLTITKLDKITRRIEANFSFDANPNAGEAPQATVTDGKFSITWKQ